jgi:Arc/MetJ-type ribon-helix-helix transcriptional regulator
MEAATRIPAERREDAALGVTIAIWHPMAMARTQTLVQLSDELLAQLDARAAREGTSRSEVIRRALDGFLRQDAEAAIDRQIVESYTRRPQDDLLGAELTARAMIDAEPWA